MSHDDPLAPDRLARYEVPGAPPGFASSVMAAIERRDRAPLRRWGRIAGAVAAAAAIVTLVGLWRLRGDDRASGMRIVAARETVALGARAVAVAEPGTAIGWTIASDGAAVVDQSSGRAFYRVERGGAFAVRTPLGVVDVTGTCFSVEVKAMKNPINRDVLAGASIGAALATAVVVIVYEGGVTLAAPAGRLHVAPGETAIVRAGEPPRLDDVAAALDPHHGELADARARIATLEKELAAARGEASPSLQSADPGRYAAPSQDTLREMADKCWIAFDQPPFSTERSPELVDGELATAVGIGNADRVAINAAYKKVHDREIDAVRRLYMELVGADADATAALSLDALKAEITAKSSDDDELAARRAISRSRAGLDPEPTSAELARRTAIERLLRIEIALGGEAEAAAASVVGAARARELRVHDGGPGWQNTVSDYGGCDRR
jgi:hypothetical protein